MFVQTLNPAALAARMPSTPRLNTPLRSTHEIVRLLHAVQVDVDEEARVRLELVQPLPQHMPFVHR